MDPAALRAPYPCSRCGEAAGAAALPLWRVAEVLAATGGRLLAGSPTGTLHGVAVDSRAVCPGDLFCAVRGQRVDAHTLLPEVWAAGGAAALVDRCTTDRWSLGEVPAGRAVVWVPDVLTALGRLARAHLERLRRQGGGPRVVGVTGSVGKTGTRLLLTAALGVAGAPVLASQDSFNTELTVPLICLRATAAQRFAALELAMRGRGQIAYLCEICRPEIGVLTLIGESHLESLGSIAAIAAAKGELVEALPPSGWAVLNADDPWQAALAARARCPVWRYGLQARAEVSARELEVGPEGSRFVALLPGRTVAVRLRLLGAHQVRNALAALACAAVAGIDPQAAADALGEVQALDRRLKLRQAGSLRVLDDVYNASPQSVEAALQTLALVAPAGQRAAVLGDMLELGPATLDGHARVGRMAAQAALRWLLCVGELARTAAGAAVAAGMPAQQVLAVPDRAAAADVLPTLLQPHLTVLVKGSRALGLEDTVERIMAWGREQARLAGGEAAAGGDGEQT